MWGTLLSFVAAAGLLIVAPGPDSTLVLRNAISGGRRAGIATAMGTLAGLATWAAAAALGISALLRSSAIAYEILRYIGAAYLVYLGVRSLIAWRKKRAATVEETTGEQPRISARRGFGIGVTTNILNPKIGIFFVTFLPAFVPPGASAETTSLTLGAVFLMETALWLLFILFIARKMFAWLSKPTVKKRFEQLTGIVLVAFGVRLAL